MPEIEIELSQEEYDALAAASRKKGNRIDEMARWYLQHDVPEYEGRQRGEVHRTISAKVPKTVARKVDGVARFLEISQAAAARRKIAAHVFGHD